MLAGCVYSVQLLYFCSTSKHVSCWVLDSAKDSLVTCHMHICVAEHNHKR